MFRNWNWKIRLNQPLVVFFRGKCASRIAVLVPSHPLYICQCSFILIRSERSDYAIRHSTGKCIWVSNIIEFYRIYRSSIYHSPLSSNGNNFWQEENLLIPINVTRKYLTMSYWLIPSAMWVQPLFVTKIYFILPHSWCKLALPELSQFNLHFTIYLIGFRKVTE